MSDNESPLPLTTAERVFVTAFGVVFVLAAGNWYLEWKLVSPHDGRVFGAAMMAGLVITRYALHRHGSPVAFTLHQNLRYLLAGALAATSFVAATFLTPLL